MWYTNRIRINIFLCISFSGSMHPSSACNWGNLRQHVAPSLHLVFASSGLDIDAEISTVCLPENTTEFQVSHS